jgi:hypothetical protein
MSDDELFVLMTAVTVAIAAMASTRTGNLSALVHRDNPGLGLVRLSILAAMGWVGIVLAFYADPSVVGVYVAFYLIIGYAVVKLFGQIAAGLFGLSTRIDAGERRNLPAALFIGAFTLATGLIFGGSLWGEADPEGGGEGGWWIPLGFFLLGWLVLVAGLALYLWRESTSLRRAVRQERQLAPAVGAASFCLSTGILMTNAVHGDFFGWTAGLKDVGLAAGLLVLHELVRPGRGGAAANRVRRAVEVVLYLGVGLGNWALTALRS